MDVPGTNAAETEGFEPSRGVNPYIISSDALSASQARLLYIDRTIRVLPRQRAARFRDIPRACVLGFA